MTVASPSERFNGFREICAIFFGGGGHHDSWQVLVNFDIPAMSSKKH